MKITVGKGGVGKTLIATSIAVYLSSKREKTVVIDYDGGHSVKNTLGITIDIPSNEIFEVSENLSIVVIDNFKYTNIKEAQSIGMPLSKYFGQFPEDLGIIPLLDMIYCFFGIPTDTPGLQKFSILVANLVEVINVGYTNIIIDVEPTAGLERLLMCGTLMAERLVNLKKYGLPLVSFIPIWKDVKAYLRDEYVKNIDIYSRKIETTVEAIKSAEFLLVCIPENGPVNQTFEVRKIVENFGGKIHGCIVNNIRNEEHENTVIEKLIPHNLPILKVEHSKELHISCNRMSILMETGKCIVDA